MSAKFVFGSSAAYLAVTIAERASSLLLFPLMTRVLTPGDYGVMLLVSNGAAMINLLFGFSLIQALPTLFSNASSENSRRAACTTIIVAIFAILFALYAAAALLSNEISAFFLHTPAFGTTVALGALSFFVSACSLSLALITRLLERHELYLAVQLPALLLQVGIIATLFLSGSLSVTSQYIATAAAGLLSATTYIVTLRYWLSGRFQASDLGKAGRIGAQMLPWQIATLLTMNSAAFFLTRSGHLDQAGLFLVATGVAGLMLAISTSFANVWTPFVLLRKDQHDLAGTQVRIFSLYSSALLITATALSLFSHELFVVIAGPAFRDGYRFVPALALAYCVFSFADCFAQGLQARQRTIHYAWIGVVASSVFVVTAFCLTGIIGAWGIIAAMTTSFLVMLVLLQSVSARFLPVAYPWRRHGMMWIIATSVVSLALPLEVSWAGSSAKLVVLICVACLPFLFGAVRWSDLLLTKNILFPITH